MLRLARQKVGFLFVSIFDRIELKTTLLKNFGFGYGENYQGTWR